MKRRVLLTVLIVLLLCFIWGNSMKTADESSRISGGLLELFPVLKLLGEHVVRKLGHFSEFTALGMLLCLRFYPEGRPLSLPLAFGILTAMTDETIQLYVPGRSSEVMDVWIDTGGICFGMLLAYLLYQFILKGKRQ